MKSDHLDSNMENINALIVTDGHAFSILFYMRSYINIFKNTDIYLLSQFSGLRTVGVCSTVTVNFREGR